MGGKHGLSLIDCIPCCFVPLLALLACVYAVIIVVFLHGKLVAAAPSPLLRGAVLINMETTPLSLLIFHLRDMGELWHHPGMPLIKVGPHLP